MCVHFKLGIFHMTSVSSMFTAESRHNRSFLLKSYYPHFSWYSCFPHIQAICQVTMTGAGTCKQDICIQEIALLHCAFPQAVTAREPKYGYISAEGPSWQIAFPDNVLMRMTRKCVHVKQEVAPAVVLNWSTQGSSIKIKDCRLLLSCSGMCVLFTIEVLLFD